MTKLSATQERLITNAVAIAATKLLFDALKNKFPSRPLSETVTIHNGQGLRAVDRDETGQYNVYAAGGLVGKHSATLTEKPFVVIGRKGSAGKPSYAPFGGWVIDTAYYVQPNNDQDLDCEFLFHAVSSLDFTGDIISTAIPGINRTSIYRYSIPIPPRQIQETCVRFLNAAANKSRLGFLPELPPGLEKVGGVIARIEKLAAKIEEARRLRKEVLEDCENFCRAIVLFKSGSPTPMCKVVTLRECDVIVNPEENYEFAGVYCFGGGVFKGLRKSGSEFAYTRLTRLEVGNFVYPKLMAWEGALGIVPPSCDGLVVSPEFPVFEIDESLALPETLDVYFRTPAVWPSMAAISTGTNVRRRRLHPSAFLRFEMPLPSMEIQLQLRKIRSLIDGEMRPLQDQTAKELDALMPTILSKAFAGEL